MKEKLKIGDKVYHKEYPRWSRLDDYYKYISATVERLTATQAILSNGVKLINEPVNGNYHFQNYIDAYCVYGNKWEKYLLETPESIIDGNIQNNRAKIYNWFSNKKFTEEEQTKIYNLLNPIKP